MKIRSHLMILVLGAVLPVFVFSAAMTAIFWREQRKSFEDRFLDRARALTIALDGELAGHIHGLRVLAQSEPLRTGDFEKFYHQIQRVREGQTSWRTLILADRKGAPMINARFPYGAPLPGLPIDGASFNQVVTSRTPLVSSLFADPISQHFTAAILVPVMRD